MIVEQQPEVGLPSEDAIHRGVCAWHLQDLGARARVAQASLDGPRAAIACVIVCGDCGDRAQLDEILNGRVEMGLNVLGSNWMRSRSSF